MRRVISANLVIDVSEPCALALAVTPTRVPGLAFDESLTVSGTASPQTPHELLDAHGTRLHRVDAGAGRLEVHYEAVITGRGQSPTSESAELIRYVRPSRYCESDSLAATASVEFDGLEGVALLDAVSSWVRTRLDYVSGSSLPTDGAVRTLLARQGVCRDFAHLCVALLRARGVPTRFVSVYAPGLDPMDFHAVCEAWIDGNWLVVDATSLAPRQSMLRIATGRDAADTAFFNVLAGNAELIDMEVTATVEALPQDDATTVVVLC